MGAIASVRALLRTARYVQELHQHAVRCTEAIQRLEIEKRHLDERLALLEAAHVRLRNKFNGELGGRPRGSAGDLDSIPPGDKAALRKKFGIVPTHTRSERE